MVGLVMRWWSPHPEPESISYQEMVSVIRQTITDSLQGLQTTIDNVRTNVSEQREDVKQLRKEMREGFAGVELKTYSREMIDAKNETLSQRIADVEATVKEHAASSISQSERVWTRIGIASGVVFGTISLLISFLIR
jgi:CHASE3 domain sensor protein